MTNIDTHHLKPSQPVSKTFHPVLTKLLLLSQENIKTLLELSGSLCLETAMKSIEKDTCGLFFPLCLLLLKTKMKPLYFQQESKIIFGA